MKKILTNKDNLPKLVIAVTLYWYIGLSAHYNLYAVWSIYDQKRVAQLLITTSTLLLVISSRSIRDRIGLLLCRPTHYLLFSAITMLALFASLNAPIPIYSLLESFTFLSLAMFSLTIAAIMTAAPKLIITSVILATWTFMTMYVVEFLSSYIAAIIIDGRIDYRLLFPYFSNIRFFNQFQVWLIPLSLIPLLTIEIERKSVFFVLYLIAGLWITVAITSQSKGAQLALLIGLLATLITYRKNSRELLKNIFIISSIGIAAYLLLFQFIPIILQFFTGEHIRSTNLLQNIENIESSKARLMLWKTAVDHILSHPLLGIGPMHYAYIPGPHAHPHNSALQISSEFGLPFFILVLSLFILFIRRWIHISTRALGWPSRKVDIRTIYDSEVKDIPQIWILLFFSVMSGLTYSLVSGVFVMPMAQTMMAIVFGLMLGLIHLEKQKKPLMNSLIRSIAIQLTAGLLAIGLLLTVLPHLTTRILNPFFASWLPANTAGPRYWELGGLIQNPAPNTFYYYEHPALTASTIKSQN